MDKPGKTILFVSTANLSSKPRMLKEAVLASEFYNVKIVCFATGEWTDANDVLLAQKYGLNITVISARRKPFVSWLWATLVHSICKQLFFVCNQSSQVAAWAENKRSFLLYRHLQSTRHEAHLIVARGMGTLYPAFKAAQYFKLPLVYDVEDYHPGEKSADAAPVRVILRRKLIFKNILSRARAVTFASSAIQQYVLKHDAPGLESTVTVDNCFSEKEFIHPAAVNSGKIKLVWFSLYVGPHRGLEELLEALKFMTDQFEVHLIGRHDEAFKNHWQKQLPDTLFFLPPMEQEALHQSLSRYDVGLALEMNHADINRQLCLTNKIWAYHQAGLFVLATDTPAQTNFMHQRPNHGMLCGQSVSELAEALQEMQHLKQAIRDGKEQRYIAAKKDAWENEAEKVKALWNQLLENGRA